MKNDLEEYQCWREKKVHDEEMNGNIIHNTMVIIPIITNSHLSWSF